MNSTRRAQHKQDPPFRKSKQGKETIFTWDCHRTVEKQMNTFEDEIRCLESYKNLEGIISKCTKDRGSLETSAGISRRSRRDVFTRAKGRGGGGGSGVEWENEVRQLPPLFKTTKNKTTKTTSLNCLNVKFLKVPEKIMAFTLFSVLWNITRLAWQRAFHVTHVWLRDLKDFASVKALANADLCILIAFSFSLAV